MRIVLFIIFLLTTTASAQDIDSLLQNKRIYKAVRLQEGNNPEIDGLLDDEAWQLGIWQGNFTQQQPNTGQPGTENTEIKICYDHSNLYVAIRCFDSIPDLIRDIPDRRDALAGDMAGIAIDSYFDKRTAFEFNLSAAGQKMDVKHLGDYEFDYNWDAVWEGASLKDNKGWYAEMRIPFSQLRYSNNDKYTWGMHVWRWIARRYEEDQWQLIPREAPAMVYLFGELEGIKNIRESRQVEFLPYTLGLINKDQGMDSFGKPALNMGLDSKVGIGSDLTLDLTINPDFGQVEADPSVLNLTSFETFYEEKRPFFLEGNDAFDFSLGDDLPYYSRRIGSAPELSLFNGNYHVIDAPSQTRIIGAAKLTGKTSSGITFGLINGLTESVVGQISGEIDEEKQLAPLSNYLATRIKKENSKKDLIIGGMLSAVNRFISDTLVQSVLPDRAYSAGFDIIKYWDNKNYHLKANSMMSNISGTDDAIFKKQLSHIHYYQRIDAEHIEPDSSMTSLFGHGGVLEFGKNGGDLNFSIIGQYRSPGLNLNDLGYMRQADFYGSSSSISYTMNEPKKRIRNYTLAFNHSVRWSMGNELTGNSLDASVSAMTNKLWRMGFSIFNKFSSLDTRELRGGPALRTDAVGGTGISLSSNTSKNFYFSSSALFGKYFGFKSYYQRIGLNLTWLPLRRLKLNSEASFEDKVYHQQYVASTGSQDQTSQYIVSDLIRKSLSLTIRAELFVSNTMSLQYYGNPYFSVGDYSGFDIVNDPDELEFSKRVTSIDNLRSGDPGMYGFDYSGDAYLFADPDFSFQQFRSNLVFRWEYKTGSTLYFVWTNTKTNYMNSYKPLNDTFSGLGDITGGNTFMVKFNYWFAL